MAWDDETANQDVAVAGRRISECIARDVAAQIDLEDALEASRYATQPYSSRPKEWPTFVEVIDARELPPVLVERYNASGGEGTALCGIFTDIRRAWASVDNSLFLWRFDKWDGQCPEYSGEDQAICAVGIVKAKPGIFVEAIQYLLILATPVEVILIGVCCSRSGDGRDLYAEISLQPLPEYTISSDGVTMTCISCAANGHIFMAGHDGHIYEVQYTKGSSWQKHCRKVCLTSGLSSLISRWVVPSAFKFSSVDPIVDMVVDNERHMLYARTEDMKLRVFDLGPNGQGPLKKVAEERNLVDQRGSQHGARRSTGSRTASAAAKTFIMCIAPISTVESKWLHLVAILSDGRRIYLSTAPASGNSGAVESLSGLSNNFRRPCYLKVVTTRSPPPLGISGGTFGAISQAGRSSAEDLTLKVEAAYYSSSILILSDSSSSTVSSLLILNKDPSKQSSQSRNIGIGGRGFKALHESVFSLPIEGKMLYVTDIYPSPETTATLESLYSDVESCGFERFGENSEKISRRMWAMGDLATQHILPRRRMVVFSTMGMLEVAFNRPIDTLRTLFESNAPGSVVEDFFHRFGSAEAAAMCLMLAAKVVCVDEIFISSTVSDKAAEAFEDPKLVGMPQLDVGGMAVSTTRTPPGGFSMGQVVQEAEPVFSGAHRGLCLCASRLLFPMWELPVMVTKSEVHSDAMVIIFRLSTGAMQVIESKIRLLELFLQSRHNQRRGLYGYVAGLGGGKESMFYGTDLISGTDDQSLSRHLSVNYLQNTDAGTRITSNKRQKLPHTLAELAVMEVRAMELIRRLLRRAAEALFLLQLLSQHHVTRLVQGLDADVRQQFVQLTFHHLVCSKEGAQIATNLIAQLMEYYVGLDGRGTVDDISAKLREGCPSYYKESDYNFFSAVECLERAAVSHDPADKEKLAREALNALLKVPESADLKSLKSVCKRFEDLRFYEAMVKLPLLKAQFLDSQNESSRDKIDLDRKDELLDQQEQCYAIIFNALRSLKGDVGLKPSANDNFVRKIGSRADPASRDTYIRQIVQLSVQWPDKFFHERLYHTMIDLGLENELLEYGGPDLVPFLQNASREPVQVAQAVSGMAPLASPVGHPSPANCSQVKYLELLARHYVMKRQHVLSAHIFLRLAEKRHIMDGPTLEQRHQYLSNAVLQAKSAGIDNGFSGSTRGALNTGLLDLVEGKLAVLHFQMKLKEEMDALASRLENSSGMDGSALNDCFPQSNLLVQTDLANRAREKVKELSMDLKSITQLYNEYAVPFELWEICLEMLHFASYSGDADSNIVRETWARLLDQALSRGGVNEACSVLKRAGPQFYLGDGPSLPLDLLCLHLEKAALERSQSGIEIIGDEDVARALLGACGGSVELVLSAYYNLISSGAVLPSPNLRLRLLRSVLVILREWSTSTLAGGMSGRGASLFLGRESKMSQSFNQGTRDKIASAANMYMTEVRRLPLPQSQTEAVYRGFRELEEAVLSTLSHGPL